MSVNTEVRSDRDWYLEHLTADVERFAAAVRRGPLDAPISGCPGWDLRQLTAHMGVVHRWARHCAANAAPPESRDQYQPDPELDAGALADWLVSGGEALVGVLRTIDLDGPDVAPVPRRQARARVARAAKPRRPRSTAGTPSTPPARRPRSIPSWRATGSTSTSTW